MSYKKDGMGYRFLGSTGLLVSELCLGAMSFGGAGTFWGQIGALDQDAVNRIVARALDGGINFIDTANVYAYGESEQLLGKAIKGRQRENLVIATKVRGRMSEDPNDVGLTRHHILNSVEASLRRLGTDYIDLYQIHGFDPHTPIEETLRVLDDLVRQGKVRYIGASNLAGWQLARAMEHSAHERLERFESMQSYYSLAGRGLEREVIPAVEHYGLGVLVWSPLAGGLVSGKFRRDTEGPEDARRSQFDFPPADKEQVYGIVERLDEIASAHSASVAQIALAWLLHRPAVTSVIIGVKRLEQLEDNLGSVSISLTDDELATLDEVSKLQPEYPGWMLELQAQERLPSDG
jgi:aryl-alcohol dehydrogenase-like predicted oxidoreductase